MDISGCSFDELSYSTLFKTYLSNFDELSSFYEFNPLNEADMVERAEAISGSFYKTGYLEALEEYHSELGILNSQEKQRKKLRQENALVIVTGQQLGLLGGPLYTIYKTMTAILLARQYEQKLNRPVVPVFWLADEDHDFEEIAHAGITGRKDFTMVYLDEEGSGLPVSEEKVTEQIESFKAKVKEELFDTDFTGPLWDQINKYYKKGNTHAQAFAGLINDWFSDQGLLIAGSNFKPAKKLLSPEFANSIENADQIYTAVENKSSELEESYHRQVMNGDSNLFYVTESEGRIKINRSGENWTAGAIKWSNEELLDEIKKHAERFSPNVFLRPIIQDKFLPTLGYVAGPGELAYYGQMKDLYNVFDLKMPPIIPRFCGTLIESSIARIMEKLPFPFSDYGQRIEDLESEFVEQADTADIEKIFISWKQTIEDSADQPLSVIKDIDPTLEGTVGKTIAGFGNELDKLKGRVYRSIKKQEEIQINRIEKIKVNLYPDGGLQERAVSPVYFMNKYGLDIWDNLLAELEEQSLDLKKHHLIEL